MKDRLRRLAASVSEATAGVGQRLRPAAVDDPDDDAELLPPLPEGHDAELEALDQADDDDVELGLGHFTELLRRLDPPPPLPLTEPFSSGLVPLLIRWGDAEGSACFLSDRRVRRVLGVISDRFTVTVAPEGITVRGLLRRRFTPWERVQQLTFVERYEMIRDHALEGAIDQLLRTMPVPIPGLRWVLRKVVDAIEQRLPQSQLDALAEGGGSALQHIRRRGFDLELTSALALVVFLSDSLSTVAAAEAQRRGIPVEGWSPAAA